METAFDIISLVLFIVVILLAFFRKVNVGVVAVTFGVIMVRIFGLTDKDLIGGFSTAILWEILRHLLVWYLAHLSRLSVVYGSLSTAVVALFSMELAATLLLLGAQVIAEYEQLENWSH